MIPLGKERKGDGEHVFPQNICGSWKIYDVCPECMRYFGDNVDQLSIKNPNIINSLKAGKFKKSDKYFEQLRYKGKDVVSDEYFDMVLRGGVHRLKIKEISLNKKDIELLCSDEDFEDVIIPKIYQKFLFNFPKKLFDSEIEEIKRNYKILNPGDQLKSKIFNITIRKGEISQVQLDEETLPSISPLIAKIVLCFLFYILNPKQIALIEEIELLKDHARNGKPLTKPIIYWHPFDEKQPTQSWHGIKLSIDKDFLFFDVTLFGSINWRVILRSKEPIGIQLDGSKKDRLEMLFLVNDFESHTQKPPLIGIKYIGIEESYLVDLSKLRNRK